MRSSILICLALIFMFFSCSIQNISKKQKPGKECKIMIGKALVKNLALFSFSLIKTKDDVGIIEAVRITAENDNIENTSVISLNIDPMKGKKKYFSRSSNGNFEEFKDLELIKEIKGKIQKNR